MERTLLEDVKEYLRISHSKLDNDISDTINAATRDLQVCGVDVSDLSDPLIKQAVKLYCKARFTDDTNKSGAFMDAYNAMKGSLMVASEYKGGGADE